MEQDSTFKNAGEPNPIDTTGLCLLSLDGGGIRGLSSLYILKSIMDRLNHVRREDKLAPVKPCEVFDLIGGTSTGGIIAIMLGRLEMDIDKCIDAYRELAAAVFGEKLRSIPVNFKGDIPARFDSAKLDSAIQKMVEDSGASKQELFNDGTGRGCRTFVCTSDRHTKDIIRLRSYSLSHEPNICATICQAALATSAATTFFEPVSIGDRSFADGGLGANNPVDEVEGEAANIWCSETEDLKPLVKCFISIGTGNPGKKPFADRIVKFLWQTVVQIATETENTERRFEARWAARFDPKRYFRFNIEQGLQPIWLEEYRNKGAIELATVHYLTHAVRKFQVRDCVQNMRLKQNKTETSFATVIQEYTIRTIGRQSAAHRTSWIVPFERNTRFTGRESQLDQLERMLFANDRTAKIAIVGLGGVGKTQLVLELLFRTKEKHPGCSVIWIPATNKESLHQAYLYAAQQLNIPGWEDDKADVLGLVQEYLGRESTSRWLLVFDHADDIDMWINKTGSGLQAGQGSRPLIDYLPKSKQGTILFTTRDRRLAVKLAQQNVVEVPAMEEDAAARLLQEYLVDPKLLTSRQDTNALLSQLTYLPLAIVQAASYINKNGMTITDYLSILADQEGIIHLLSREFEDAGRYPDVNNAVAATWLISFEKIRERDLLATDYLSFMACVEPKDIPQSLLPPGSSRKEEIEAIAILTAYSFIVRRPAHTTLDVHWLVHLAIRNWLRKQDILGQWTEKAIERLKDVFPDHDYRNRRIWRQYLPHAAYVLASDLADRYGEHRSELLWRYGMCLYQDGRWNEAEVSLRQLVEIRKTVSGPEHPDTISAMSNLAITLEALGRLDAAAKMKEEVLGKMRRIFGEDHPSTIRGMNNLASALERLGRLDEAAKMQRDVLEKRRRILGEDHPDTITAMNNLGPMLGYMGHLDEAARMQKEVLEKRRRILGVDDPDTITAMNNLGSMLRVLGKLDEAVKMQKEVLDLRSHIIGEEHSDTLSAMNNLAVTLEDLGHLDEATTLLQGAVHRMKQSHSVEHPRMKVVVSNLARLDANQSTSESTFGKLATEHEARPDATVASKSKLTPEDAVIVVLGATGAGKSYFVRAATGDSSIEVGASLESVTDKVCAYRTEVNGQPVVLVDTIGFDDTYRSDVDVLREIAAWLADTYAESVHLAGVLYMHDIRSPRFTGSAVKNLRMFEKLVGEAALSNVVLVASRWDAVDYEQGEMRLEELTRNRNMWGIMIERGSTVECFSGTAQDARRILRSVLDKERRTILNIQQELVDRRLDLSDTEAGKFIVGEINELRAELRDEMKKALESKDAQLQSELEGRLKKYEAQISDLKSQRSALEERQRLHNEEIRRLEDSVGDRLRFLEELTSAPPPAYTEVQSAVGTQASFANANLEPASMRSNYLWTLLKLLWQVVQRLLRRRPRAGYRRLEWRCTCGELLYGDFKETTPGSIDRLAARLSEHSGRGSQRETSTPRQTTSKAHSRLAHSRDITSPVGWNLPRSGGSSDPNDPENRATTGGPSASTFKQRQALQLCIETGKFTLELRELDSGLLNSDGLLFEKIREKYERARHSMFPMRLRFRKPEKAIFIKFRLGKRPLVSSIAGSIDTPSIPSEAEVKAGNYTYIPCPIDEPPIDNRTFFHHFYAPASKHPDSMWCMRLPWKLGPSLTPMAQGWGIHLEERPDWPLFAAFMFLFLLLSGLVAGIYSFKTGDHATGVAIGAWLTAVQTMGMTALFFRWT